MLPANAPAGGDWTYMMYPFYRFSRDVFLAEGRLPMWNNMILGGQPHLVSLNSTSLYPTELLSLPLGLPSSTFFVLDMILHLLLAGIGFAWWMRKSGRGAGASFTGGLVYMLGCQAFTLAAAGHPHTVRCLGWLPLIFALVEGGAEPARPFRFALAGGMLGLCLLTAAAQFVAYAAPVFAVWIALFSGGEPRERTLRLSVFGLALAGVGAVMWMPGLEYYTQSTRSAAPAEFASRWALSPWEYLTLLFPELFGAAQVYFGPHLFRGTTDYAGLLTLAFATIGAVAAWRGGRRWVALGFAAVILAMGPQTPVGWLVAKLPVYGGFRNPLRWLVFLHIAVCVLAARGWDAVPAGGRRVAIWCAAVLCMLAAPGLLLALRGGDAAGLISGTPFVQRHLEEKSVEAEDIPRVLRYAGRKTAVTSLLSAAAMGGLVIPAIPRSLAIAAAWAVLGGDLLVTSGSFFQFMPLERQEEPDAVAKFLVERRARIGLPFRSATDEYHAAPNRRMPTGLEWISGYHGLPLRRYSLLLDELGREPALSLLALLNVRYIVSVVPVEGLTPVKRFSAEGAEDIYIYENPQVLPRAYQAAELVSCPDLESVFRGMRKDGWKPDRVLTDTPLSGEAGRLRLAKRGTLTAVGYGRDEIVVDVNSEGNALLVFSENWYPAWKCFVNGRRVGVIRAYGVLRALAIPGGECEIRMIYDSWLFKIGLWITSMALLFIACGPLMPRKGGEA